MANPVQLAETMERRIGRAALNVLAAGLLVKIVAFAKETAVAATYARTDALEAFLLAALVPMLIANLLGETLNQALIPGLIRVRQSEGQQAARWMVGAAMLWLMVAMLLAMAVLAMLAPTVAKIALPHFSHAKQQLTVHLFYQLMPVMLLAAMAGNGTAVLNAAERFTAPTLAPMLNSLAVLVGIGLFAGRWGIEALVWATLVGALVLAAVLASWLPSSGYAIGFKWLPLQGEMRQVARSYALLTMSAVVANAGLVADQTMAAWLPAGSVAALNYSGRLVSVVVSLLAGALATALTPYLAQMAAEGNWTGCRTAVEHWLMRCLAVTVPLAGVLIAMAHPIVRILYQRGNFHAADSLAVAPVLAAYALQIPFFAASRVDYRMLLVLGRNDVILRCGAINLLLDVVLNLLLMHFWGVVGIALATSMWTISTFVYLRLQCRNLLQQTIQAEGSVAC